MRHDQGTLTVHKIPVNMVGWPDAVRTRTLVGTGGERFARLCCKKTKAAYSRATQQALALRGEIGMSSIRDAAHPILPCLNWEETIAFYDKLGFALGNLFPDQYQILHRDGIQLHFWKCNDPKLAESSGCYIRCVDADALHTEFAARGIKCSAPEDRSWGVREFHLIDSNGNLLRIGGPLKTN
jgi:catechol 2,3-dioxygenase-like lactoylglutathione lyase family enzyme